MICGENSQRAKAAPAKIPAEIFTIR